MRSIFINILILTIQFATGQTMEIVKFSGEELEVIRTYHDNGQLSREWTQMNNQLHGYYKEFFENGIKKSYVEYRNGKKYRIHTEWYKNGAIKQITKESGNLLQQNKYDEAQTLISKMDVSEQLKPTGKYKTWYPNGKLRYDAVFNEKGNLIGTSKSFYEDSSLQLETINTATEPKFINQIDPQGKQTIKNGQGVLYKYNIDGSIHSTTEVVDGLKNGKGILFKNGKIHCESTYINGKSEGPTYWYYSNGKVKEIIHMKNGAMERAERNFPMYDNPILTKTISLKPSERRDNENKKIIPEVYPQLMNTEAIINAINLSPSIYDNRPQDMTITEVYRVYLTESGKVKEFNRSSGSGYPVRNEIEKSFELMKFDMKKQRKEGVENQIWITFTINQIEKE